MISKKHLRRLENIVDLLDNKFQIGPFKFGIDPLLGFIPFLGDLIPTLFSLYLIMLATLHKAPKKLIMQMTTYSLIDFFFGSIPVIGDIIDIFYKSHTKNLTLLKKSLQ